MKQIDGLHNSSHLIVLNNSKGRIYLMKFVVLAAGEGTRLRPYTKNCPKCMVPFQNRKIIDWILQAALSFQIKKVIVVSGYHFEVLQTYLLATYSDKNITLYKNINFSSSNMVETFFCAKQEFDDDLIVSYGDIIYKKEVLKQLLAAEGEICVVIDKKWRELWELRMEDPLQDAETLKLDENGYIVEIGKKPSGYGEIQGQYIGLIKISKSAVQKVIRHYDCLDRKKLYDGQSFSKMYMTSFIQSLIDSGMRVSAIAIEGGWAEIDTVDDLMRLKNFSF